VAAPATMCSWRGAMDTGGGGPDNDQVITRGHGWQRDDVLRRRSEWPSNASVRGERWPACSAAKVLGVLLGLRGCGDSRRGLAEGDASPSGLSTETGGPASHSRQSATVIPPRGIGKPHGKKRTESYLFVNLANQPLDYLIILDKSM
jgi:hypothetical protein